jgi:hypothetical protein
MKLTGAVTRKEAGEIEIGLKGSNQLGDHVIGTVVLALPDKPITWKAPNDDEKQDEQSAEKSASKKFAKKSAKKSKKGRKK